MTSIDINSAPYGLSNPILVSRFSTLVKPINSSLAPIDCVDASKYLKMLIPSAHVFHTLTIPAIHSNKTGVFAVEFYDRTTNTMNRIRRFYNLVIGMCQSGQCKINDLRHSFFYLQIRASGARNGSKFQQLGDDDPVGVMAGVLDRLVDDSWEYEPEDYLHRKKNQVPDEYRLTGLICEKAYILFDDEVQTFVERKAWR